MNLFFGPFVAALGLEQLNPARGPVAKSLREHISDIFLVLAAILALTLVLLVWAKYLRKSKSSRSRSRTVSTAPVAKTEDSETEGHSRRRRRRHKRRRQDFRDRNPTLAETGGLPPLRSEGQPPTSPVP
jgi:hypothetical protein